MNKITMFFLVFVVVLSSCLKEEEVKEPAQSSPKVILVSPANQSQNVNRYNTTFEVRTEGFTESVSYFEFEFQDLDDTYSGNDFERTSVSNTLTINDLAPNVNYRWRVLAVTVSGAGYESDSWSFQTGN